MNDFIVGDNRQVSQADGTGNRFEYPYKDNVMMIVREAPYGLMKMYLAKGETPSELKDQRFTSLEFATRAVDEYLEKTAQRNKKVAA